MEGLIQLGYIALGVGVASIAAVGAFYWHMKKQWQANPRPCNCNCNCTQSNGA